jgi:arylsulfatase A-like enzyme
MKILVITVRGLHAGYLGCYGNEWIETPTIDSLASEGVVFDQHYAEHPESSAARSSWRSGRYVLPTMPGSRSAARTNVPDLLAILRSAGVVTHLVIDGTQPSPRDFTHGWDHVSVVERQSSEAGLEGTLSAAVHVLDGLFAKQNWLVWVDLATLVPPWNVPEEYVSPYFETEAEDDDDADEEAGEPLQPLFAPQPGPLSPGDDQTIRRLQYSYASALTFLDAGLEALIEELGNLGLGDEIVFLLTSDHGLPLGEHGILGAYRAWLHDELIHVPLLLSLPHSTDDVGRRVPALTQSCDLMPTLLELFGQPIPADVQGRSLVSLARGQTRHVRPHAVSGLELNGGLEYALRTTDWAYLLPVQVPQGDPPRSPQLYAKPEDRWEANNLIQHHPELAEQFDQTLRQVIAHGPGERRE